MHNKPAVPLVALLALLVWAIVGGPVAADGPAERVLLAVTEGAAVGEITEIVATVTAPDNEPVGGVEVTFSAELEFLNTFGAAVIGRIETDEKGVARLSYVPRASGEIEIMATVGDLNGSEFIESFATLSVATGPHLVHPEDAAHIIRGRWDWFVQWTWLVIMPAAAFAAFLGVLGLLWAIGRDEGGTGEPRVGLMSRSALIPVGGAVAVFALAVVLIVGIALRPWGGTDTSWRTELNLVHQIPTDYTRSTPALVDDDTSLGVWRSQGAAATPEENPPARLYVSFGCASCHGLDGTGGMIGPNLLAVSPDKISENVRFGPTGMPVFDPKEMTDEHVSVIIEYLRQVAITNPEAVPTPVPPKPTPTPTPAPTATPVGAAVATPTATPPAAPANSARLEEGRAIYEVTGGKDGCAFCHGLDARGVGLAEESAPDIRGATRSMIKTALDGTLGMSDIKLTNSQINAVVEYLRYLAAQP